MSDSIVIVSAARTPMGSFQGDFASLAAHDLGGAAIKAAVERAGIQPALVDEVIFGNCLMAGQGQAPARQAGFKGGLPKSAGAVTLSKMCGSGMRAAMFAHDMLLPGSADVVVAGGMESMTNAPYLLPKARGGYRIGHDRIFDHMMLDGLEDAYEPRPLHGHLRRRLRRQVQLHPRGAGRLRHPPACSAPRPPPRRQLRWPRSPRSRSRAARATP
jgi:acetyl-CoA C-acetyltransferase